MFCILDCYDLPNNLTYEQKLEKFKFIAAGSNNDGIVF